MYINKDEVMARITKEDVKRIVMDLGSEAPREDSHGDLIFQTVCHGSDSWKLYYYHEPTSDYPGRMFHCYTKCGDSFSLTELVIRANRAKGKNVSFYQALSYIAKSIGYDVTGVEMPDKTDRIDDWNWLSKFNRKTNTRKKQCNPIDEHVLEMFDYTPHELFLNDHISREVLSEFEISYWGATNQIVIPHRDINGRLIGIRGRYLDQCDIDNIGKYVPLNIEGKFLSHELGSNLYGIHINKEKIKKCKKCMIVEAEKSVMQNHSYFGKDDFSLGICGSNLTQTQKKILLKDLGVEEIILGLDKEFHDAESWEASIYRNKLLKKIASLIPYCKVTILWDFDGLLGFKDSPTDKGKDVLLQLLDKKVEITIDDLELMKETMEMNNV